MNILIYEDHKLIAMALEDMLSAQGHRVEGTVDSACDCLARCAQSRPVRARKPGGNVTAVAIRFI